MARKKKHEEHVNHERWLVSYADFITLLFAFFTTLYAISTVDAKKAGKLVFSMRSAFNVDFFTTDKAILGAVPPKGVVAELESALETLDPPVMNRINRGKLDDATKGGIKGKGPGKGKGRGAGLGKGGGYDPGARRVREQLAVLVRTLQRIFTRVTVGKHVRVRLEKRGLVISLEEIGFFAAGSARLRRESLAVLDKLGGLLVHLGYPLRVEGHSDGRGSDAANWDLSVRRAVSVIRRLVLRTNFPPARLVAAGYGSHRPIVRGSGPEAAARNRRVDLVILSSQIARDQPP